MIVAIWRYRTTFFYYQQSKRFSSLQFPWHWHSTIKLIHNFALESQIPVGSICWPTVCRSKVFSCANKTDTGDKFHNGTHCCVRKIPSPCHGATVVVMVCGPVSSSGRYAISASHWFERTVEGDLTNGKRHHHRAKIIKSHYSFNFYLFIRFSHSRSKAFVQNMSPTGTRYLQFAVWERNIKTKNRGYAAFSAKRLLVGTYLPLARLPTVHKRQFITFPSRGSERCLHIGFDARRAPIRW